MLLPDVILSIIRKPLTEAFALEQQFCVYHKDFWQIPVNIIQLSATEA